MTTRDTHDARTPYPPDPPPRRDRARRAGPRLRLTARGAVVCVVLLSLVSALLASAVEVGAVNGAGFVAACVLAALLVRPADLLALSVSPPLAYFVGTLAAECLLTLDAPGFVRAVAIGVTTRLAEVAPWLFAGTALVVAIALARGLAHNVRELSDELNGRSGRSRR